MKHKTTSGNESKCPSRRIIDSNKRRQKRRTGKDGPIIDSFGPSFLRSLELESRLLDVVIYSTQNKSIPKLSSPKNSQESWKTLKSHKHIHIPGKFLGYATVPKWQELIKHVFLYILQPSTMFLNWALPCLGSTKIKRKHGSHFSIEHISERFSEKISNASNKT